MSHKKAVLLTCCVAFLWSLAGWNIKMIQWSPFAIAGGRSIIAAILLLPVMIKKGIKVTPAAIGGAVCYMAFNYLLNKVCDISVCNYDAVYGTCLCCNFVLAGVERTCDENGCNEYYCSTCRYAVLFHRQCRWWKHIWKNRGGHEWNHICRGLLFSEDSEK